MALAAVMLGPVLGPGAHLTLDLVLIDPVPVPRGAWGLGPELPRRVPLWIVVAGLSPVIGGDVVGKALMAASVTVAFVGMHRLVSGLLADRATGAVAGAGGGWPAAGAGVLYAAGPFLTTRLAVGHLMVAIPAALLPWVLPHLLRPRRDRVATFLAAAALGVAGHVGGLVVAVVVGAGLVGRRRARGELGALEVVGLVVAAQLPWLVPGLVVAGGSSPVDAAPFASAESGPAALARLLVGGGFWQPTYDLAVTAGPLAVVAGVLVAVLALIGAADLPADVRVPAALLTAFGLLAGVAGSGGDPGGVAARLSRLPGFAVGRESHRLMVVALVVLVPAAALGAARLAAAVVGPGGDGARPLAAGAAAACASLVAVAGGVVALPAAGGIDGRLHPVALPAAWTEARDRIAAGPGTVLALPWHQYLDVDAGGVRRVLHPVPLLVGGDVLVSSDPGLGQPDRPERLDRREPAVERILADARAGRAVSGPLADLGVRWVLVLHEVDWRDYRGIGSHDDGLRPVVRDGRLDLWEVEGWATGWPGAVDDVGAPLLRAPAAPAPGPRPYQPGWRRGLRAVPEGPDGLLAVPGGSGPVWFAPALAVVAADVVTATGVGLAAATVVVRRRSRAARRPFRASRPWPRGSLAG